MTCSLLFVVDPKTRRIEEVGEGVDYGVRKRRSITLQGKGKEKEEILPEDEKLLKGVRICRECRPVLMWVPIWLSYASREQSNCRRQQNNQEVAHVPTFMRLYEVIILFKKNCPSS